MAEITEHPNVRLRADVESLRQEVKTLTQLYTDTAQAMLLVAEELKELKAKMRTLERKDKTPPSI